MDKAKVVYTDGDEEIIYFQNHDFDSDEPEHCFIHCYIPQSSGMNLNYINVDVIRINKERIRTLYLYDSPILPLQLQRELARDEEPEPVDHFEDVEDDFI